MQSIQFLRRLSASILVGTAALVLMVPAAFAADTDSRTLRIKTSPVYPDLAKRMNISGVVKLEITIAPNGVVKNTKVIGGHPLLVGAAEDAVKKWKYEPAQSDTTTVVEFHFTPGT